MRTALLLCVTRLGRGVAGKPVVRSDDRLIDTTPTAREGSEIVIRKAEVHDRSLSLGQLELDFCHAACHAQGAYNKTFSCASAMTMTPVNTTQPLSYNQG